MVPNVEIRKKWDSINSDNLIKEYIVCKNARTVKSRLKKAISVVSFIFLYINHRSEANQIEQNFIIL